MCSSRIIGFVAVLMAAGAFLSGCETSAQSGALIGAGGGALLGQAIGGNTTGTLIGAGVGAGAGYIVGNEMDKKAQTQSQQDVTAPRASSTGYQASSATTTQPGEVVTVTITNSNGSKTPVVLHKEGSDWVGPKGEHYDHLPTEAELKPVYGF